MYPIINTFEEHKSNWIEIGQVKKLQVYPLTSCHPINAKEIMIGYNGITFNENLWDEMFVIYNNTSKCVYNNNATYLSKITVKYVENDKLELSKFELKLTLNLNKIQQNEQVICTQLINSKYIRKKMYYDCGDGAADWLDQYLKNTSENYCPKNVRLGFSHPLAITLKLEDYIQWLYMPEYDEIKRQNLPISPSCKVMSQESFLEVKKNLKDYIEMSDFSPNIIITTKIPFKEDEMDLFKIGDSVIKTIRPRLKSRNEAIFHVPTDMRVHLLSLHCETFIPGIVKVADKVYTAYPDEVLRNKWSSTGNSI
ncbi:mitochondrial amidoxime reducing component 2-like [Odontomachus brunneus]|uniref:mitochondrial amidoxime reducing component 2-like n=1 Tax=Odontomachus brunneus TaxID=486640 RepID=UPI0013F2356C|nr:mitochondrial amidoxime reducing component 2-like [Odontomachus brunneus]XP_032679076.1 mitochondrial amidoxime reducing component 2-like [Odontomachus brunneus]XP_032679077.1 mitochondrial amidoxime reducing component 2-like [Odontomachus brunneus]